MEAETAGQVFILTLGLAVLLLIWRAGLLSGRAFEDAPQRRGRLNVADLLVGCGLWVVGLAVAGLLLIRWVPADGAERPGWLLGSMLVGYLGMVPCMLFILWRAHSAMEGGLAAFGFGRFSRGLLVAVMAAFAMVPITLATSVLTVLISQAMGQQPPTIAHDLLRILAELPGGPVRWGIIFSAVVLAPIFEEVLFRGLFQTTLLNTGLAGRRWLAILIASAVFTLVHLGALYVPAEEMAAAEAVAVVSAGEMGAEPEEAVGAEPQRRLAWQALPVLFVLSLGLGYIYERSGSLWAPIGLHALFNAFQIGIALLLAGADGP